MIRDLEIKNKIKPFGFFQKGINQSETIMAVIVPIEQNSKIVEYIFEIAENIPNDFYVDIMNLMKHYHENGDNLLQIHEYLNLNENKIDKVILKKIRNLLKVPYKCSCNCSCNCTYTSIIQLIKCMWFIFICLFFFSFIGVLVFLFVMRK